MQGHASEAGGAWTTVHSQPQAPEGPNPLMAASVFFAGGWYGEDGVEDLAGAEEEDQGTSDALAALLSRARNASSPRPSGNHSDGGGVEGGESPEGRRAAVATAIAAAATTPQQQQPLAPITILDDFYSAAGGGSGGGADGPMSPVWEGGGRWSSLSTASRGTAGADPEPEQGTWYAATGRPGGSSSGGGRGGGGDASPGGWAAVAPPVDIDEDYVQAPPQLHGSSSRRLSFSGGGGAGGGAAPGGGGGGLDSLPYGMPPVDPRAPCPITRVALRGLSSMWVLHEKPPSGRGGEGRLEVEMDGMTIISEAYGTEGGQYASRLVVVVGRLEVRDCGAHKEGAGGPKWVKVLAQRSGVGVGSSHAAAYVAPAPAEGAAAAAAAAAASAGSSNAAGEAAVPAAAPPGVRAPLFTLVLDAVRPDPVSDHEVEEYRLALALLPLRLRLDQDVVAFLSSFGGAVASAAAPAPAAAPSDAPAGAAAAAPAGADFPAGCYAGEGDEEDYAAPYFQCVDVRACGVLIDYRPRRVDVAALRDGSFAELLNLVPWGGVDLSLKALRLHGLVGWDGLAAAAAREWLSHVARTQAHKFVTGVAPISSVCRVGSAVAGLLAVPATHFAAGAAAEGTRACLHAQRLASCVRAHAWLPLVFCAQLPLAPNPQRAPCLCSPPTPFRHPLHPASAPAGGRRDASRVESSPLSRQLRASSASFARALVFEALGLGASVAGGAQMLLQGTTVPPVDAPASVSDGLRQAASRLSSGFGAAADVLVAAPVRAVRAGDSWQDAARQALRAAPAAAAAPASAAAAAVRYTLLGVRSALDPERKS